LNRVICLLILSVVMFGPVVSVHAEGSFEVYQKNRLLQTFHSKIEAITYAKRWDHASIKQSGRWVWNNYPYQVYQYDKLLQENKNFREALSYAKKWDHTSIRKFPGDTWVWNNYPYLVYKNGTLKKSFPNVKEAVQYAKRHEYAEVRRATQVTPVFSNRDQFRVFQHDRLLEEFKHLSEAIEYAKKWDHSRVERISDAAVLWSREEPRRGFVLHNAPLVIQNPELPRGCEVTSITMLLQYAGKSVTKNEIANQLVKDETPIQRKGEKIKAWGDPNIGFVGNMFDITKPGYGVYHRPLHLLLNDHMKGNALDLTGMEFGDVLRFVEKDNPVVVIINSRFRPVHDWISWEGPTGVVRATFREHAVLLVGYDKEYVYVNDPLSGVKNRKLHRGLFKKGWEQMGQQAVSYSE
jgi:uncharacterized protein YvpB